MAGRRSKGEGSIRQRKDGRWEARVTLPSGKRKSLYGKSRAAVARKLATVSAEISDGSLVEPTNIMVAEYLDDWLDTSVKRSVREVTLLNYRYSLARAIPIIGDRKLAKLSPRMVQTMFNQLHEEGLAPSTLKTLRRVLNASMNQAVTWGMIPKNPVTGVTTPKLSSRREAPLDEAQARQLVRAADERPYRALWYTALMLGLRRGEILGLRWRDVDLENRQLHIRQVLTRVGQELVEGPPKTEKSRRTLRIPDSVAKALEEHQEHQKAWEQSAGARWEDHGDFVFTTRWGRPIPPSTLRNWLNALLEEAELPHLRFHDLRHACATLLLSQGVDLQVVKEIMGHSSIAVTADLYAHVLPSLQEDAAAKMDRLLSDDTGSNKGSD